VSQPPQSGPRSDPLEWLRPSPGRLQGGDRAWTADGEIIDGLIGNSAAMRAVLQMIDNAAETDATVLTWGESGVGKEMVPRLLHQLSPRRYHPFVKVNCAALPLELLESELFGYERGAFTGAHRQKPGKFEQADKGTIFLDEIGEMPLPLQAKLLHVLQDREFSRLGSEQNVRVDVRVVAATNKELARLVEERVFRADLYYRLNVVNIPVPPLRDRREEIPVLAEHFLRRFAEQYGRPIVGITPATMRRFMDYAWPGNVRELENIVKRIVVLRSESWVPEALGAGPTPGRAGAEPVTAARHQVAAAVGDETLGLKEIARRAAADAEREAITRVLDLVRWNRMEASRRLKVNYKTLLQKIQEHGLGGEERSSAS
jgi:two-component system, NtrC family, response regulator AtoC